MPEIRGCLTIDKLSIEVFSLQGLSLLYTRWLAVHNRKIFYIFRLNYTEKKCTGAKLVALICTVHDIFAKL